MRYSPMRFRGLSRPLDIGSSSLTNGAANFDTGSLDQRITFTWVSDFGSSQSWCVFQVRNTVASGMGYGYNYQKAVNSSASDYALINYPGGQTNINGLGYNGSGTYVVQIVGSTFTIKKNGSNMFGATFSNATVEAAASTYCYVNTSGGTISGLYIEGL